MLVKGRKVYLRAVRETDLDALYLMQCDVESRGPYFPVFIPSETQFKTEFHRDGFLTGDHGRYLICDMEDRLVGEVLYFRTVPYFSGYEVGYRLFDPGHSSNQGFMTEALQLGTYLLFVSQRINRLELRILPENIASKRVAEKCGYQFEGVERGGAFLRGEYVDLEVYAILRAEAPCTLGEALSRV